MESMLSKKIISVENAVLVGHLNVSKAKWYLALDFLVSPSDKHQENSDSRKWLATRWTFVD